MKKSAKKLNLCKETLIELAQQSLQEVAGGLSKAETLCCPSDGSRYC